MINLLVGQKGSGKTQQLMDLANQMVKNVDGNVVFVKKTHSNTSSLSFNIRTICMDDYPAISTADAYVGFIYGMYSANSDIQVVFIDGILKLADVEMDNIPPFIAQLNKIAEDTNIKFYVSISADKDAVAALPDVTIM